MPKSNRQIIAKQNMATILVDRAERGMGIKKVRKIIILRARAFGSEYRNPIRILNDDEPWILRATFTGEKAYYAAQEAKRSKRARMRNCR